MLRCIDFSLVLILLSGIDEADRDKPSSVNFGELDSLY